MNDQPPSTEQLEQWTARQLRPLPLLRAPQEFSQRVIAELQRRAALPWWRKSFVHWSLPVQLGFMTLCLCLAKLSVALLRWLSTERSVELSGMLSRPLTWTERLIEAAQSLRSFCELVVSHLPTSWLYVGLLAVILLYGALFGIGATAYRTLYASR
jgi:hypothetical protein